MEYTGLLTEYKINRPLSKLDKDNQLHQEKRLEQETSHELTVIEINSTYIEVVDKFFYWKDLVREVVLPLLGRIDGATCNRTELTQRLREWFEQLPEPATLMFDYFADWELLADAFLGDEFEQTPKNVGEKQMLTSEFISNPIFQCALYNSFTPEWPAHHALVDARAFRHAFIELLQTS